MLSQNEHRGIENNSQKNNKLIRDVRNRKEKQGKTKTTGKILWDEDK